MSFGGDTKSRRSLLSGVYARGSKISHTGGKGPFKCYVTQMGVGGGVSYLTEKSPYEGVMFNVISVTRGWVGVQFQEK